MIDNAVTLQVSSGWRSITLRKITDSSKLIE
jgi:hypothetical protein